MTIIWIIVCFLAASYLIMNLAAAPAVFLNTMYRNPKKTRTRACSDTRDEDQKRMFAEGIAWSQRYRDKTVQLSIVDDGLNLYGEYLDLGFERCAIILQGRTESLLYSYYFADVYARCGYNILVIDPRAHGLSDGSYHTAGIRESDDLVAWIQLINARWQISDFTLHGVCVGAATALYAYVKLKEEGSDLIKRIVTDGLFISNYEMYKRNFRIYKQPPFPALHLTFLLAFLLAKVRMFRETPLSTMGDIDIPILFIWSEQDIFCVRQKNEQLFAACASDHKELCFFPEGRHSHVRSAQEVEYDKVIASFLQKHA
ncbi:MAG: lysophospholipase [Actinomycetia bacterium]|nr:lysophospholipase [Actinomycetes bacterium]